MLNLFLFLLVGFDVEGSWKTVAVTTDPKNCRSQELNTYFYIFIAESRPHELRPTPLDYISRRSEHMWHRLTLSA